MKTFITLSVIALGFAAQGCSSTRYSDPKEEETLNVDWGSTDLQTFSRRMADSLLASPGLSYIQHPGKGDDLRIVAYMGGIGNETTEHINVRDIMRKISTSLVQSGRFRLVADAQGQDEIGEQVRFQQGSGRVDPNLAKAFGKQLGAETLLYGNLRSIEKSKRRNLEDLGYRSDDVWYQFVLECVDVETGELIWIQEKDIRKTRKKGIFGA
jgi:uncharacterized protein (TIGR02722 family)